MNTDGPAKNPATFVCKLSWRIYKPIINHKNDKYENKNNFINPIRPVFADRRWGV